METTTSKRPKGYQLPLDSCVPGHPYQTGDGLSIFFSPHKNPPLPPKLKDVLDINNSGLESIDPVQEFIINGKVVRLYKFTRKKRTVEGVISFESVLEDLLLVTASYGPKFIGNIAAKEILPKLQQLGKTFSATVYSPCEKFMHDYHGQIFGFKIFGEKEDQLSKHNYSRARICMAGYVLVVCEK
jgi:hypothetical protein